MLRRSITAAVAAALGALLSPAEAYAWGAAHVGYTHVGPGGVYHYGANAARGPYGAYSGAHAGAYGTGGAYHAGSGAGVHYGTGYGGTYHYDAGTGGAYHYGAVGVGGSGAAAGVYRRY